MSSIECEGIITRATRDAVTVSIESQTSCEGCRARGACGKTREIVVRQPDNKVQAGERVRVQISDGNAARSALLAYVVPSAIAIGTVAAVAPRAGDAAAAVVALCAVAAYFLLLFRCRARLSRGITFTIVPR
ncbi:MAG: SoxR reducing system RseC family protein [Odoribacteraceae bacterium]|jgi:sigma-E factor negative regulatory protein RseC|nr:SoxR reducing system RseC family protein [Odoribacteraceae bacterium]